jgi:hypothetical protein
MVYCLRRNPTQRGFCLPHGWLVANRQRYGLGCGMFSLRDCYTTF